MMTFYEFIKSHPLSNDVIVAGLEELDSDINGCLLNIAPAQCSCDDTECRSKSRLSFPESGKIAVKNSETRKKDLSNDA